MYVLCQVSLARKIMQDREQRTMRGGMLGQVAVLLHRSECGKGASCKANHRPLDSRTRILHKSD